MKKRVLYETGRRPELSQFSKAQEFKVRQSNTRCVASLFYRGDSSRVFPAPMVG